MSNPFHASTAGPLLDNGRRQAAVKSRDEVDLRSMVKADHVRRGTDVAAYLSSMLAAKPLRSVRPLSVAGSTRRRQSDCPDARGAAPRSNERMRSPGCFFGMQIGLPGHSDGWEIVFTGNFLTVCRSPSYGAWCQEGRTRKVQNVKVWPAAARAAIRSAAHRRACEELGLAFGECSSLHHLISGRTSGPYPHSAYTR